MTTDAIARIIQEIDEQRSRYGFMKLSDLMALCDSNTILDPLSTLISNKARLGIRNVIYPNVILEIRNGGELRIADGSRRPPKFMQP